MENNRWEGNQTNIRFIKFEIQNRIEVSLPLSRVMMPKVPISSFQWRRNCVQRRILGCREKSRGYFTWTKQTKFYDVLTHSRKQKHTPTHSHTHTVEMCVVVFFQKCRPVWPSLSNCITPVVKNLLLRLFYNQIAHGGTKSSRLIHSSCGWVLLA